MAEGKCAKDESKIVTFYEDVSDEVDMHFTRALNMTGKSTPRSSKLPSLHQILEEAPGETRSTSPTAVTAPVDRDAAMMPHFTQPYITTVDPWRESSLQPPFTMQQWNHPSPSKSQFPHTFPHAFQSSPPTGKSGLVYPEFVNYLVHPEVDSYKDLPKLPGQRDPSLPCPLYHRGWGDGEPEETDLTGNSPLSSYPLFGSEMEPRFTDEDLKHILELREQDL